MKARVTSQLRNQCKHCSKGPRGQLSKLNSSAVVYCDAQGQLNLFCLTGDKMDHCTVPEKALHGSAKRNLPSRGRCSAQVQTNPLLLQPPNPHLTPSD